MDRPAKKVKLLNSNEPEKSLPNSLTVPISPPHLRRPPNQAPRVTVIPSPFKLTWIRDLPDSLNIGAVTLVDIIGDPLIKELWSFNYLTDVDFLMSVLDDDIRDMVKVNVVHGFWKDEESAGIKQQALKYPNVTLRCAFMPFLFGTHHQKSFCIIRHDDTAQIVIHTANIIAKDWCNLTQAVWMSPHLPLLDDSKDNERSQNEAPIGSGQRFKIDLLNYWRSYNTQRSVCKPLVEQLAKYDFSEIRGALVGSVPGNHDSSGLETPWGWAALENVLCSVPAIEGGCPEVVVQVSSIASLGQTDKWLDKTLIKALSASRSPLATKPKVKVIFPTADEVRRSLDGYDSGRSIHTKIQTAAQAKQLDYLRPRLHHWAGDGSENSEKDSEVREAGRRRAAPHIKTYVRYASPNQIDWALVTSANLSKQAHGEAVNAAGDIRICSYELGVLVWPELFGNDTIMVPTFKKDMPDLSPSNSDRKAILGFRMPYDLPLAKYEANNSPWCATASYNEPDWMGQTWST